MAGIEEVESPGDAGVVSAGSTNERGNPGDAGVACAGSTSGMCCPTQSQAKNEEFAPKMDLSEFEHEPLKSINLKKIGEQRSIENVEKLALMLIKYKHLLSNGELGCSHKSKCQARHPMHNHDNIGQSPRSSQGQLDATPRRLKVYMSEIVKKAKEGVIEPSRAPWYSNALLDRKDGKIRMVTDYRALNKVTIKDSYPMSRIQERHGRSTRPSLAHWHGLCPSL